MSALKAYQVDGFLVNNSPVKSGVYLIYGSDDGLIHERALQLSSPSGIAGKGDTSAIGDVTILNMNELDSEPEKLAVLALTPSMFGEQPVIRIRAGNKSLVPTLENLLQSPLDAIIVIEASNLTKRDKLRILIEGSNSAWALPCYADDNNSLKLLISQFFIQHEITIDHDALMYLCSILGNNREITRRELEKLQSFAGSTKHLNLLNIQSLCGDNSSVAVDQLIDATATGQMLNLEAALNSAYAAGLESQFILNMCARHFLLLRAIRGKIDQGATFSSALASIQPRPHFSRKSTIENQAQRWNSPAISRASKRIFDAILQSRQQNSLEQTITRRALLGVCLAASKR